MLGCGSRRIVDAVGHGGTEVRTDGEVVVFAAQRNLLLDNDFADVAVEVRAVVLVDALMVPML
ncbi:hypothetical protein C5E46_03845 [Nocardia nova]|nr:hypothetical protein C5E46_03845 [Nocardia nova]